MLLKIEGFAMRILVALFFSLFALTGFAQKKGGKPPANFKEGFYLYFGAFQGYKVSDKILTDVGATPDKNFESDANAGPIGIGYRWKPKINFEIDRTSGIDFAGNLSQDPFASVEIDIVSFSVFAEHQISDTLDIYGKAGFNYLKLQFEIKNGDEVSRMTDKHFELGVETGLQWTISSTVKLRVGRQYINFNNLKKTFANLVWSF